VKRSRCAGSLFALSCLVVSPAFATIIHVPGDYPTIQAGIDAAVAGDIVEVACGTYAVPEIIMKSGITLRSETGEANCVIVTPINPYPAEGRLLRSVPGIGTVIEGLSFVDGHDAGGGAIHIQGSPTITRCNFISNRGAYLRTQQDSGASEAAGTCGFSSAAIILENSAAIISDCLFQDNNSSEGAITACGSPFFERCRFVGNRAQDGSGGAVETDSGTFISCVFSFNHSFFTGGAAVSNGNTLFEDCWFDRNDSNLDGGAVGGRATLRGCLFSGNDASALGFGIPISGGGALRIRDGSVVDRCIFFDNFASLPRQSSLETLAAPESHGSAILIGGTGMVTVSRTIAFANIGSEAIYCESGASISVSCSNIFGNPDGDWTDCIANQLGLNGNISVDPMFCDAAGGDFHLSSLSPCLYADCGVMGAFGQGCFHEKPALYAVEDVGNDQGRQVRLTWQRSLHDSPPANPYVIGYAIYRKKEQFAGGHPKEKPVPHAARGEGSMILGWDYLGTVPSRGDSVYETVAPTLCDSTIANGQCLSTFFISAMTSNPFVYYDSPPLAGYSKDNLEPPTAVPSITPERLALLPNVPNPFNPSTRIAFATPSEGAVRIAIYDARGSLIRVLIDKSFPAGHHGAVWDGRDGNGSPVSSGVYMCRLEHGAAFRTRKIVLIK
jgi:hypothetical protein